MSLGTDPELRSRAVKEYLDARKFADSATRRVDELKKLLLTTVVTVGTPDEKGNLWCPAGDNQLKHERRSSVSFDSALAEEWAKANGYWEDIKEVVVTERVNEDLLHAIGWEHPELSPAILSFYKEKVTWAFKVVEQKSYDDE